MYFFMAFATSTFVYVVLYNTAVKAGAFIPKMAFISFLSTNNAFAAIPLMKLMFTKCACTIISLIEFVGITIRINLITITTNTRIKISCFISMSSYATFLTNTSIPFVKKTTHISSPFIHLQRAY